jgi:hypothetical protein
LGNVCALASFFWYVRPLLWHRKSCAIIAAWAILRTAIAFGLARDGTPIVLVLVTLPIEAYVVVTFAKLSIKRNKFKAGTSRNLGGK